MSVYKIFPIQDATIYSQYPTINTGLDAILELSKVKYNSSSSYVARSIVKFSDNDINNVFTNYIGTGSFSASLNMYLATAGNIPLDYSIELRAVYDPWDMGTGRYENIPKTKDGASWSNKNITQYWITSSYPAGVTGSFPNNIPGGSNWYTGSISTQSFGAYTTKDISLDATDIVTKYKSGSYQNNGFIVKNVSESDGSEYLLQYFSRDTNTIYPPSLDLKWDDSIFSPVSQSLVCTNSSVNVFVQVSDKINYLDSVTYNVRINVRDKFPTRLFSTGSLYTVQKYLPSSSYWSLIDYKTKDVVIPFDTFATKISADNTGNFFKLFMSGLEPSRYYEVLIKSVIGSETVVFNSDYIFKVV